MIRKPIVPRQFRSRAVLAAFFLPIIAEACTIPVFRYALDRWPPDDFVLTVPTEQSHLLDPHQALLDISNVFVSVEADAKTALLMEPQVYGAAPVDPVPVDLTDLPALLDSPARREVAKRILEGEAFVLVLVGEPDSREFQDALATIETHCAQLRQTLELPYMDPNDPSNTLGPGPELAIALSVLPVAIDDPREKHFIAQLKTGMADTPEGAPLVIPIFGQGRALGVIPVQEGLVENLDEVGYFLTGACSCQVKHLNPGWDLLMAVDWDDALLRVQETGRAFPEETPSVGTTATLSSATPGDSAQSVTSADPGATTPASGSQALLFALGGLAILVLVGGAVFLLRK